MNKTWIIDLDGTLVVHNGYLKGGDRLLSGVKEFFLSIDSEDYIIITTARSKCYKESTESFLKENNIRYNTIIFDLPHGERVLINDKKPDGYLTAYAINKERDGDFYVKKDFND